MDIEAGFEHGAKLLKIFLGLMSTVRDQDLALTTCLALLRSSSNLAGEGMSEIAMETRVR